jgi:hypothetical protein
MILLPTLLFGAAVALAAPVCTSSSGNNTVTLYLSPGTISGLQLALHLENLEVNLFQSASSTITGSDVTVGVSNMTLSAIKEATVVRRALTILSTC